VRGLAATRSRASCRPPLPPRRSSPFGRRRGTRTPRRRRLARGARPPPRAPRRTATPPVTLGVPLARAKPHDQTSSVTYGIGSEEPETHAQPLLRRRHRRRAAAASDSERALALTISR